MLRGSYHGDNTKFLTKRVRCTFYPGAHCAQVFVLTELVLTSTGCGSLSKLKYHAAFKPLLPIKEHSDTSESPPWIGELRTCHAAVAFYEQLIPLSPPWVSYKQPVLRHSHN